MLSSLISVSFWWQSTRDFLQISIKDNTYQLPFTKLPVYNYQFQKLPNAKDTRYVWMFLHSWWEETFTEFLLHIMFYVFSLRIKRSHSSKEERDGESLLIQIQCGIH